MKIRALATGAFGSVLILAGCRAPTPSPAPLPNELQGCAMCEVPCPDYTGPVLAATYVAKHYPEQAEGLSPNRPAEDWIIKETGSSVVVTNIVTGFRWEGNVVSHYTPPSASCCNGYSCTEIVETSVTMPVVVPCEIFQPLGEQGGIGDIESGDDGTMWIAGSNGAARLDPKSDRWGVFGESQGLPVGNVRVVTPDTTGTAWLVFWDGPLYYFNGERWEKFAGSGQIQADRVLAVSIAPDQSVWFASDNGVYRWDRNTDVWKHYTEADGLHSNVVSDILFTPDGKVWFAGLNGVSYLDQSKLAGGSGAWWSLKYQNPSSGYGVAATSEDGKVWFGGQRYFDTSSQSWVDAVYRGFADHIAVDSRGGLWVGSDDGALYIPDPDNSPQEEWQRFTTANGLGGNRVHSLAIGDDGSVWFGADRSAG
jgi:streptogramin lyase